MHCRSPSSLQRGDYNICDASIDIDLARTFETPMKTRRPFYEKLEGRNLLAVDFGLLGDVNTTPSRLPNAPGDIGEFGEAVVFSSGAYYGRSQLWSSANDVDHALTLLLDDSFIGVADKFLPLGENLLFNYGSDARGQGGLWSTNATPASAQRIGPSMNVPVELNGQVFYIGGENSYQGNGVWRSDGTLPGTQRIFVNAGPQNYRLASPLAALDGKLYVVVEDLGSKRHLATIDQQTGLVEPILDVPSGSVQEILVTDTALVISFGAISSSRKELYGYTNGQTELVHLATANGFIGRQPLELVGNRVYFPVGSSELWSTDGTLGGTAQFLDSTYQTLSQRVIINSSNSHYLFVANHGNGYEYFHSGGTSAGTRAIGLTYPGYPLFPPLAANSDAFYIVGVDPSSQDPGLYRVLAEDGSTEFVQPIADLYAQDFPGQYRNFASFPAAVNGRVFFVDKVEGQQLLLEYLPASKSVVSVTPVVGTQGSDVRFLAQADDHAWVLDNYQIWQARIQEQSLQATLFPGDVSLPEQFRFPQVIDGSLSFESYLQTTNESVRWRVDASTNSATVVGNSSTNPLSEIFSLETGLFQIRYDDMTGGRLYELSTDLQVESLVAAVPVTSAIELTFFDNRALFEVDGQLWQTDGTASATQRIDGLGSGDKVLDEFRLGETGELWWFTAAQKIYRLAPGSVSPNLVGELPNTLTALLNPTAGVSFLPIGSGVAFVAESSSIPSGLWISDGTPSGTVLLADLSNTDVTVRSRIAGMAGERIIVSSGSRRTGYGMWSSDGTPGNTFRIHYAELAYPQFSDVANTSVRMADGRFVFQYFHPETGRELWITDGTSAGTVQFADISPGASSSDPSIVQVGQSLLTLAATETYGARELFAADYSTFEFVPTSNLTLYASENLLGTTIGKIGLADVRNEDLISVQFTQATVGNTFALDAATNTLMLKPDVALDFESQAEYHFDLDIEYRPSAGAESQIRRVAITVRVVDMLESLTVTDQIFEIDENAPARSYIGQIDLDFDQRLNPSFTRIGGWPFYIDSQTGRITVLGEAWRLDYEQQKEFVVAARVDDGLAREEFRITIRVRDVNEPPAFSPDASLLKVFSGEGINHAYPADIATDPEGQSVDYSMTKNDGAALPDWLSFDSATLTLVGTPPLTAVGTHDLRLRATDPTGLVDTHVVKLQVFESERPWFNVFSPLDVNDDGIISPLDVLLVVNLLNQGTGLPQQNSGLSHFYDTSGDNFVSPLDVLIVINYLNLNSEGEGLAEPELIVSPVLDMTWTYFYDPWHYGSMRRRFR